MANVNITELDLLKTQLRTLANQPGGKEIIFEIFFKLICNVSPPTDANPNVTVQDARKNILLSETPSDKSLWFRVNYELGKITLEKEEPLHESTGDEFRLLTFYANSLAEPDKTNLLNYIAKIQNTAEENKVVLPDLV